MTRTTNSIFLREIATLINAGFSPLEAIGRLDTETTLDWSATTDSLRNGQKFYYALSKSDQLTPFEIELIKVSESSGRLVEGLKTIAESSEARTQRRQQAKSKLVLPFGVLLIAILVGAIINIVRQPESSIASPLFSSILFFAIAIIITRLILAQINKNASELLKALHPLRERRWYQQLFQQVVFGAIYWQIKSGIDFKTAFKNTSNLVPQKQLQKELIKISRLCGRGQSVQTSIQSAKLPLTEEFRAVLGTAEKSGEWNQALERFLKYQQDELNDTANLIIGWLPRIYYFFVLAFIMTVIF